MYLYERTIINKLLLVRTYVFVLCLLIFYTGYKHPSNLAYLFIVIFIFSLLIKITKVAISSSDLELKTFYCFGLIPVKQRISFSKIKFISTYDDVEIANHSGTFVDIIFIFFPVKGKFQGISVSRKNGNSKQISLNDEEFQLLHSLNKDPSFDYPYKDEVARPTHQTDFH